MSDEHQSAHPADGAELRLDLLLGRKVLAAGERVIFEYVIGGAGLMERLNVGFRQIVGLGTSGHVARWDQIDVSDPRRPRLRCAIDQLKRV